MTDQQTFNRQNRFCISGREGCPVCIAPLRHTAHRENFTIPKEEILGLPEEVVETVGLCMLVGGTEIHLGDKCSFPNEDFEKYAPQTT